MLLFMGSLACLSYSWSGECCFHVMAVFESKPLARNPVALLDQPHLRINGLYYITKVMILLVLLHPPQTKVLHCLIISGNRPSTEPLLATGGSRLPGLAG